MSAAIHHADSDAEITACFLVMRELRPALAHEREFAARVARQREAGYRLLAAWRSMLAVALAGYRVQENLLHGRHIYVDDLVALASERSHGHGARLLQAVMDQGRTLGCGKLVLGANLANARAHRFYYRQGMLATGLGFTMTLD